MGRSMTTGGEVAATPGVLRGEIGVVGLYVARGWALGCGDPNACRLIPS